MVVVRVRDLFERPRELDSLVQAGGRLELYWDDASDWRDIHSIIASRWVGRIGVYLVVDQSRRSLALFLKRLPRWLQSSVRIYFLAPERGGLSVDERTMELLDIAQVLPELTFFEDQRCRDDDHPLERDLSDGVAVVLTKARLGRLGESESSKPRCAFPGFFQSLSPRERASMRWFSSASLRPFSATALFLLLGFFSMSSLLDRVFIGSWSKMKEAYRQARAADDGVVESLIRALMVAAINLRNHPWLSGRLSGWLLKPYYFLNYQWQKRVLGRD